MEFYDYFTYLVVKYFAGLEMQPRVYRRYYYITKPLNILFLIIVNPLLKSLYKKYT